MVLLRYLHCDLKVFLHSPSCDGQDQFTAATCANTAQGNPPVDLVARHAPEFLSGKLAQVSLEIRDEVVLDDALGDIPFIGRYLFSSVSKKNRQTELIVLLTPYVLTNNEELLEETERRYDSTDMMPADWPEKGWSDSKLRLRPKPEQEENLAETE